MKGTREFAKVSAEERIMSSTSVVVKGVVKDDGTLELSEKVNLPPGPVQVTVQPAPEAAAQPEDLMTFMEKIWAAQRARGHAPRSAAEVDAEIREMRDEWEEHQNRLEALQEDSRRLREEQERAERQAR
jgi:hypothetical protein